jgi:hypothetical protein
VGDYDALRVILKGIDQSALQCGFDMNGWLIQDEHSAGIASYECTQYKGFLPTRAREGDWIFKATFRKGDIN